MNKETTTTLQQQVELERRIHEYNMHTLREVDKMMAAITSAPEDDGRWEYERHEEGDDDECN